jgi:hypothetical protein
MRKKCWSEILKVIDHSEDLSIDRRILMGLEGELDSSTQCGDRWRSLMIVNTVMSLRYTRKAGNFLT